MPSLERAFTSAPFESSAEISALVGLRGEPGSGPRTSSAFEVVLAQAREQPGDVVALLGARVVERGAFPRCRLRVDAAPSASSAPTV